MIDILHHGGTKSVTGSCHELVVGDSGILVDCGLLQGIDVEGKSPEEALAIDFPIAHIRALVVTHVHIDHVGRIPYLLAAGFEGPVLCSEPSAIMLPEILEDALKIGVTRNRSLINQVLGLIRQRIVAVPYDHWYPVFGESDEDEEKLKVRFQRAGHILGSAYVECEAVHAESSERIVFSGDLGAPHSPLLPEPKPPEKADHLVLEGTYGDRNHEDRETRRLRLKAVLEHALEDGGTVLIPAFSIGRTQELLYEIEGLIHDYGEQPLEIAGASPNKPHAWKELEIVVDSPLAATFTDIYRRLKPFWDDEATALVRAGRHPLSFEQLTVIDDHEDHLRAVDYLARTGRPCVVIAGSGMCAGGRIVNYLKAMLGGSHNDVLFVGYQAAGTPGRDILTYGPDGGWVELDDQRYTINARIHQIGGYSAHAGQSDLLRFVEGIPEKPSQIRIVHGDTDAKQALASVLKQHGFKDVTIP